HASSESRADSVGWVSASGQARTTSRLRHGARVVLEKIPFFALTAVFCVVAVRAQASGEAIPYWLSLTSRCLNALLAYGLYLWHAVVPIHLAPFYPLPAEPNLVGVAISMLALVAITVFALVTVRSRPYVLTGWLWYLGSLVPVIGVIQIGRQQ